MFPTTKPPTNTRTEHASTRGFFVIVRSFPPRS
jgi:hypothetical protein